MASEEEELDIYTDLVAQEADNKKKREEENNIKRLLDQIEKLKQENQAYKKKVEDGSTRVESKSSRKRSPSPEDYRRKGKKHSNTSMSLKSEIEKNYHVKLGRSPSSHSPSPVNRHDRKYHRRSPAEARKYRHRSNSSERRQSHHKKNPYNQRTPSPQEISHDPPSLKNKCHSRERSFDKDHSSRHSPEYIKKEPRSHPASPPPPSQPSSAITTLLSRSNISPLTESSRLPLSDVDTCELPPSFSRPIEIKRIQNVPLEKDLARLVLYSHTARYAYGIKLNGHLEAKTKKVNIHLLASYLKEYMHSTQPPKPLPSHLLKEMGLEERIKPSRVAKASGTNVEKTHSSLENVVTAELSQDSLPEPEHPITKVCSEPEPPITKVYIEPEPPIKKEKLESSKDAGIPKVNLGNESNENSTLDKEIKPYRVRNDSEFEEIHKVVKKEKSKKKKHKSHIKEETVKKEPHSPKVRLPKTIHQDLADIKDPRLKRSPPYISLREPSDFVYLSCKFKRDEKHLSFGPKIKKQKSHEKKT